MRAAIAAILIAACSLAVIVQKTPPAHPLDLNVANVKELEQVPGIGPKTAQAIVDFRHKSGRFHRVEDLLAIKGMSQRKLDKLIDMFVGVQGQASPIGIQTGCSL